MNQLLKNLSKSSVMQSLKWIKEVMKKQTLSIGNYLIFPKKMSLFYLLLLTAMEKIKWRFSIPRWIFYKNLNLLEGRLLIKQFSPIITSKAIIICRNGLNLQMSSGYFLHNLKESLIIATYIRKDRTKSFLIK